jgi:hypothetical protein
MWKREQLEAAFAHDVVAKSFRPIAPYMPVQPIQTLSCHYGSASVVDMRSYLREKNQRGKQNTD